MGELLILADLLGWKKRRAGAETLPADALARITDCIAATEYATIPERMPLYPNALRLIRQNLEAISRGERPPMIAVGRLTSSQLAAINRNRAEALRPEPPIESEIVFIGRHLFNSRVVKDGYSIDEVLFQIENALSERSAHIPTYRATLIQDRRGRHNVFGEFVRDEAVLECSAKFPRPELFSVIPKGEIAPKKRMAAE